MSYGIRPNDIDTSRHFWECFNKSETEVSARYIAQFMQERQDKGYVDWAPFTYADINDFYSRKGAGDGFTFNGLLRTSHSNLDVNSSTKYIIVDSEGNMRVTGQFIYACPLKKSKKDKK